MRGATITAVKYLLFFFNLIFAVTGLLLLLTGLVVQSIYSHYLDFLSHRLLSPPVLLTALGAIIFSVSFFGCCGAIKESHVLTRIFTLLLGAIFFCELLAMLAAYHMRDQVLVISNIILANATIILSNILIIIMTITTIPINNVPNFTTTIH